MILYFNLILIHSTYIKVSGFYNYFYGGWGLCLILYPSYNSYLLLNEWMNEVLTEKVSMYGKETK